ncbi:methyl-accepting chemotaxis protein [Aneurinibacillus sp. Ricciae_BoGa-3]|uniref:methyl-accepting chemotaxis protein n=1 Tax=Aneurinibacillus sp. Ricciae_BoGa-3 TaxID=3022697 RepID=UPI0023410AF2|nr:methyl-accepting chemotaxis protein [Aneurinibacillus sp. Ricciae_BoGa-3]WCK55656.1 methyl-accepting chemotaxis protein [Aneurinibacillus sp. Ricciae_BoGa-3]
MSLFSKSLQTKLIIISLLILAIPSIIIGSVSFQISKQQLTAAGETQLKNDTRLVIAMIDSLQEQVANGQLTMQDAQEKIKQEILGKKQANGLRPVNARYDLGKNGFFYVLDQHGQSLASPTSEGKNLWNVTAKDGTYVMQNVIKAAQQGGGYTIYDWPLPNNPNSSASKITYSEVDPHWGWVVVAGSYLQDFNSGANLVLYFLMIALGISLLIGAFIIWWIARKITQPIKQISVQAESVANGDLTIEHLELKSKDEIGRLSMSFNRMIDSLRSIVTEVNDSAILLSSSSEQLSASAEQSSKATEQVAYTMQELAAGTENQAAGINQTNVTIKELAAGAQHISAKSEAVSTSAVQASDTAKEGHLLIQKVVQQMESIRTTVNDSAQAIRTLGEHAKTIDNIVEVITGISNQTNLLALNAAIEAARAGEHGRGFAVVADEVRKLAEQSSVSAKQIGEYTKSIQSEIQKSMASMETGTHEVATGMHDVYLTGESFEKIQAAVEDVAVQISEVSASVQQMTASTEQIVHSIDIVTKATEQSVDGVQTVSASTEEQLASMEEISSSAIALSAMAQQLDASINKFKL